MVVGFIYLAMLAGLLFISYLDIKYRRICPRILLLLLFGGFLAILFNEDLSLVGAVIAMFTIFIILWIIYYFSKESLGMGDIKLCTTIAMYLGVERAMGMLMFSILMCGAAALILLIANRAYKDKSLPFAPFVAIGTIAVLLI